MNLALMGRVKLAETSKSHLLSIWNTALDKYNISIEEHSKVEEINETNGYFTVGTNTGKQYTTSNVLLAIGRRGTPRKLNVPGENTEKVAYRLLEPEEISGKNILVVGGGDSAVESAMMLADNNNVTISYRKDVFQRIKPKNKEQIASTIQQNKVKVRFNTTVKVINKDDVILSSTIDKNEEILKNDLVYIFAGGELPVQFLKKIGLHITKKYGEAMLKHK
jgi:thioredoxin reductase